MFANRKQNKNVKYSYSKSISSTNNINCFSEDDNSISTEQDNPPSKKTKNILLLKLKKIIGINN